MWWLERGDGGGEHMQMKLGNQGWGKQVGWPLRHCKDLNIYPE